MGARHRSCVAVLTLIVFLGSTSLAPLAAAGQMMSVTTRNGHMTATEIEDEYNIDYLEPLSITYYPRDWFSIESTVGYYDFDLTDDVSQVKVVPVMFTGRFRTHLTKWISPYIGLGFGAYPYEFRSFDHEQAVSDGYAGTVDIEVADRGVAWGAHGVVGIELLANLPYSFKAEFKPMYALTDIKDDVLDRELEDFQLGGSVVTYGVNYNLDFATAGQRRAGSSWWMGAIIIFTSAMMFYTHSTDPGDEE